MKKKEKYLHFCFSIFYTLSFISLVNGQASTTTVATTSTSTPATTLPTTTSSTGPSTSTSTTSPTTTAPLITVPTLPASTTSLSSTTTGPTISTSPTTTAPLITVPTLPASTTSLSSTTTGTTTTTAFNPHYNACLSDTNPWHLDASVATCFLKSGSGLLNQNNDDWLTTENHCQGLHPTCLNAYIYSLTLWNAFQSYRSSVGYSNKEVWLSCYYSTNISNYKWLTGPTLASTYQYGSNLGPSGGCCYSKKSSGGDNNEWDNDSGCSQHYEYICMMPAIPVIVPSEIILTASPTMIVTTTQPWIITVSTYWGLSTTSRHITTYSDGTVKNTTGITQTWSKYFATPGTYYSYSTNVSNDVSGPYKITTAIAVVVYEPCIIQSASVAPKVLGNPSTFTIILNSGTNCYLSVDFNDGSPKSNFTYAGNVTDCISPDPNCVGFTGKWLITVSHTYAQIGAYTVLLYTENPVSNNSFSTIANVQKIIQGFAIISPLTFNYYPYGNNYIIVFGATDGSNFQFTLSVDGKNISGAENWDPVNLVGNVTVQWGFTNGNVGIKTFTIFARNLVCSTPVQTYLCQFEYLFTSFVRSPSPTYLVTSVVTPFKFTWDNASHYNYTIDFGDGNPPAFFSYPNSIIESQSFWLTHSNVQYAQDGTFLLTIRANNHIDSQTYYVNVTVEYPICCVSLVTDFVGVMLHAGGAGAPAYFSLIWTNTSAPYPSSAIYDFDFGETGGTLTGSQYLPQKNQSQTYTYVNYGVYTVNVTVHNLVSTVYLQTTVYIVVGFQDVTFDMLRLNPYIGTEKHNYYLITNEVAEFSVTMTEGTNWNLTMDWQDTTTPFVTSSIIAIDVYTNHSCPFAGHYTVNMLVQNAAKFEARTLPVPNTPLFLVVQDPIHCFSSQVNPSNALTITYANRFVGVNMNLQLSTSPACAATYGTNPRYIVNWNDNSPLQNGSMPAFNAFQNSTTITLPHTFTNSNIYNVEVTIWNEVSKQTLIETVQVYDEVTSVSIVPRYIDSSNKEQQCPYQIPLKPQKATTVYFPIENVIVFHANKLFGSYEQYQWTFDDGYDPGVNATIYRIFDFPGTYQLQLNIANQPTFGSDSVTIVIERSTSNVQITDNSPWPRYEQPYQSYQISVGSVATDACYYMDFIDQSSTAQCRWLFFGNQATCQEYFANFPISGQQCPVYASHSSGSLSLGNLLSLADPTNLNNNTATTFSLTHKFYQLGKKHISLRVVNHVDDQTFYYDSYVTKGWCQFPIVYVRDLNKCLTSDKCKCFQNPGPQYLCGDTDYGNGDRMSFIKDQLLLDADVTINCSSSPNIWFNWTMQELDVHGNVIANSSYKLNGLNYQSYSSKILVIPPHYIQGGRYHFKLTVSPSEEVDMDRGDDTFIWIDASFLIANFYGNLSGTTVPSGQIPFDAYTNSYDPDNHDKTNKTGMTWSFYCRRSCESWPIAGPTQVYTDWGVYNTSACTKDDGTQRGCFGSGPAALAFPSSGQWSEGENIGTIVLNTASMQSDIWFTLMVIVRKESRYAYKEIMFKVSKDTSPTAYINCVTNCQTSFSQLPSTVSGRVYQRVNPTSRFSIELVIPGFSMTETYYYQWDLFSRPKDKHDNAFSPYALEKAEDDEWLFKASTGRNIRTMCIEENLWNSTFQYAGFFLRLQFWVNDMKGTPGEYWYEFFLNEPPAMNSSRCQPAGTPVTMDKSYGIACSGFRDLEGGDLFYFVKQMDMFSENFWLDAGNSKTSMMSAGIIYINPAAGLESNGFTTMYKVRIVDSAGSYRETEFSSVVEPFDLTYYPYGNPVWSILNYTANCGGCALEDFFTLLAKQQRLTNVTSVTRVFSTMLNADPSDGCIVVPCDNSTLNCTEIEMALTTMAPDNIPTEIQILIDKWMGPDWITLSSCQLDLQLRIKIRERLLGMFMNLQIPYFSYFVQVLGALYTATFNPPEVTIDMMEDVEYCLAQGIMNIDGVDPQLSIPLEADIREEACLSVTGIVANMEQTTNYYGKMWRDELVKYYPQFTMEDLVSQIKALESGANITEESDIWQLSNDTIIDNATLENLAIIRNNITLIHAVLFKIQALKQNISAYVQARKVMGETPSTLKTENLTAVYVKTAVKNISSFAIPISGGCHFVSGEASEMFGDLNEAQETIQAAGECSKNNPFVTDPSSKKLGGTVTLSFQNSQGVVPVGNLTTPIDAFAPRELNTSFVEPLWNATQPFTDAMFVYGFGVPKHQGLTVLIYEGFWKELGSIAENYTNSTYDVNATTPLTLTTQHNVLNNNISETELEETLIEKKFIVFIKYWQTFTDDNLYDDYCVIPKWNEGEVNTTAHPTWGDRRACTISYKTAMEKLAKDQVLLDDSRASIFLTIQSIPAGYSVNDFQKTTKIANYDKSKYVPVDYTLFSVMSSCKYYDEDTKVWRDDGTDVGQNTSLGVTHCLTKHLTSFASGFSVPMNTINLQTSGFLHLAENPIAFVFCCCIFCLYLILLVWCRRKDKEDTMKAGIAPLPDNDPMDKYLYQIVFYTGSRPNAGTTSKIFFTLSGEDGETDVRLAEDSRRAAFRRNGIDTFIMAVPFYLGKMTYLRIWHDNSGKSPQWYFSRFQVLDVQTGEQFFFVVDNWLAVEEGDGQVERVVPVAGKNDLTDFNQLFFQKSQKSLFDGHIWFSVFRRPPRSNFTRIQRLTCCMSLIYCTMVANIMFYGQDVNNGAVILSVGPIVFTWTSMIVAIISGLIVVPVNTILVLIFRYSKPPPAKTPMKEYQAQLKYQQKETKKEQKKLMKELKEEQRKKLKNKTVVDPDNVHPDMTDYADGEQEEIEFKNKPDPTECVKPALEPPKVVHIDTRAKRKRFQLPHWFIYIGYVLAFVTVGVGFWLIVEVAFGFGRTKALAWVISMFVSLIQSIIFVQPIKIIFVAIVYSCLCKKPEKDEYEPEEIELLENEVYLHDNASAADMSDIEKRRQIAMQLRRTRNALPPELQVLQSARERRMKEMAMWALIKEIAFYAIFLYTLMMVAYGERDQLSFQLVDNGQQMFVFGGKKVTMKSLTFDKIDMPIDFYNWAEKMFLPALFPSADYRNQSLPEYGYAWDGKGYLAGTVRFRQVRVKQNSCKVAKLLQSIITHCRDSYSILDEDKNDYQKKWVPSNESFPADNKFKWQSMGTTKSDIVIAQISTYWGGGYIADLGNSSGSAYQAFYDIKDNDWIDAQTRAVFVEFTLAYPSVNMLLISQLVVEFMPTGGAIASTGFGVLRINPYDGPTTLPIIIGEICCLLFLLYFLYREIKSLMKLKKKYFFDFWNWLEMLVIALMITALVMYAYRMQIRGTMIKNYKANPYSFNSFDSPLFWEQVYSWMIYIVLFIANVKFLRILRFNRRITMIVDTMYYGWRYMLAFFCTFMLVFMAFASAAFMFFGTRVMDFMSFLNTVESLWVIMLNVFNFSDFHDSNAIFGPIFFVLFALSLNFILVNMFLSIVNDSFAVVKHDGSHKSNDYELVDFILFKLKSAFCGVSAQVEDMDGPIYSELQDTVERDLTDCNEKVEEMVFRLQHVFKEEKLDEQLKVDWRYKSTADQADGAVKRRVIVSD